MSLSGSWETGTGSPKPILVSQLPGKDTVKIQITNLKEIAKF